VFIDKLLFVTRPLSEREVTSVRYAVKSERNQDTRVLEPRIECNVFVQKRVTFIARYWNPAPSRSNSESELMVISLDSSIRNGVWCCYVTKVGPPEILVPSMCSPFTRIIA
jgi:hypothetical protein